MIRVKFIARVGVGTAFIIALLWLAVAYYIGFSDGRLRLAEKCVEDQQAGYNEEFELCDCEITSGNRRWRYGLCVADYVNPAKADVIAIMDVASIRDSVSAVSAPNIVDLEILQVVSQKINEKSRKKSVITIFFREKSQQITWSEFLQNDQRQKINHAVFLLRTDSYGQASFNYVADRFYLVYGDNGSAKVRPRKNDIQMYHADSGGSYVRHESEVPLQDFIFSLRQAAGLK